MDNVFREKCEVLFESTDEGFAAFPSKGKLVMSPSFSDEEMAVLLVRGACLIKHETYFHDIGQALLDGEDTLHSMSGITPEDVKNRSTFRKVHAIQMKEFGNADVLAHEVRFAYEMKDKKSEIGKEILDSPKNKGTYFHFDAKAAYQAYEKSLSEKKDQYQAMTGVIFGVSLRDSNGNFDADRLYNRDLTSAYCKTFAGKSYFKQIEPQNAVRFLNVKNWNKDGR